MKNTTANHHITLGLHSALLTLSLALLAGTCAMNLGHGSQTKSIQPVARHQDSKSLGTGCSQQYAYWWWWLRRSSVA